MRTTQDKVADVNKQFVTSVKVLLSTVSLLSVFAFISFFSIQVAISTVLMVILVAVIWLIIAEQERIKMLMEWMDWLDTDTTSISDALIYLHHIQSTTQLDQTSQMIELTDYSYETFLTAKFTDNENLKSLYR